MLTTTLYEQDRIAILEPDGPLSTTDFKAASDIIDPFIKRTGDLRGLIICTESFHYQDMDKARSWILSE